MRSEKLPPAVGNPLERPVGRAEGSQGNPLCKAEGASGGTTTDATRRFLAASVHADGETHCSRPICAAPDGPLAANGRAARANGGVELPANNERFAGRQRTGGPREPVRAVLAERERSGESSERMREGISSARSTL